jgi:hypothetical protein
LIFGTGDETAGIDDNDLSLFGVRDPTQTPGLQICNQVFGIDLVLGTAETLDEECHGNERLFCGNHFQYVLAAVLITAPADLFGDYCSGAANFQFSAGYHQTHNACIRNP